MRQKYVIPFSLTLLTCALLTACGGSENDTNTGNSQSKPVMPQGLGYVQEVPLPEITGTNVVDGDIPTTNFKDNVIAYNEDVNPILQILSGFNDIWFHGDTTWFSTGSNTLTIVDLFKTFAGISGGASNSTNQALLLDFRQSKTINESVWQYNFDYVKTLTRPEVASADVDRTDKAAIVFAYLDDQRDKGYSITSGLGALADDYRTGANATSSFSYDESGTTVFIDGKEVDIFNENHLMNNDLGHGTNYGELGHELDSVVSLLNLIRDFGASTEAPKYHFDSPRPWRMESDYSVAAFSDISDVTKIQCYDLNGNAVTKYYDFPLSPIVLPITGLKCAGRTIYTDNGDGSFSSNYDALNGLNWVSGRAKDGGFPSGHTTEAVDRALGLAYAIPDRFAEMAARGVDLGTNRIVAGMHSPLDVIGGRIMGTAVTAAALNAEPEMAQSALDQANEYFTAKAKDKGFDSLTDFAKSSVTDVEAQRYINHEEMKSRYRAALTYGFAQLDEATKLPEVPKGAEVLLASRFPYLSAQQRRAVLATTEIDSNYPIINKSRGWGRLDLVMASDGYGAFNGDVVVDMDSSLGGFNAEDIWRNDIAGSGMLTIRGTGQLILQGSNTYSGGTLLESGQLIVSSSKAVGSGTLYQKGGTLSVTNEGAGSSMNVLEVSDYVQDGGILQMDLHSKVTVQAENTIYLDGGKLDLLVPTINKNMTYELLLAKHIEGKFSSVSAYDDKGNSYAADVIYDSNKVTVNIGIL